MKRYLFTLILLSLAAGARGEEAATPSPYSLSDCLAVARKTSPAILKARQELEAARGKMFQALSEAIPHLSAEAGYTYLHNIDYLDFEGQFVPVDQRDNYRVAVKAEQTLYEGGQVLAGIRAARLYGRYSEASYGESEAQADYTIKDLFYRLLLARRIVDVRQATVAHMERYRDIAHKKYEEGAASEFEYLTAQVRLAGAQPPLIQVRNQAEVLTATLAKELGLPEAEIAIAGELSEVPFSADLDLLNRLGLAHRPLLENVRLAERMQEENVAAVLSGYHPEISVFASYEGIQPQMGYPPVDRMEFEWTAGAQLRWELFDGLLTPGRVKEAKARFEQARIETENTVRGVLLDIRQARLDLESARQTIASQRQVVELAEKAYEIARVRWDNGISTYLELTDAELALSEAGVTLAQALADQRIALARIEKAVGLPLDRITESATQ